MSQVKATAVLLVFCSAAAASCTSSRDSASPLSPTAGEPLTAPKRCTAEALTRLPAFRYSENAGMLDDGGFPWVTVEYFENRCGRVQTRSGTLIVTISDSDWSGLKGEVARLQESPAVYPEMDAPNWRLETFNNGDPVTWFSTGGSLVEAASERRGLPALTSMVRRLVKSLQARTSGQPH